MHTFHPADQLVDIEGNSCRLRLTMGGLAEISAHLSAKGPQALAARLRGMKELDACALLTCLLRPCHGDSAPILAAKANLKTAMSKAANLFESVFKGGDK